MMRTDEAVWITGVGMVTPLGHDLATVETSLLAGRSGVDLVTSFPTTDFPSRIAAQVAAVPCPPSHDPARFALLPRLEQATLWCVESALRDAGWWGRHRDLRVGLVLGIGAEWMELWEEDAQRGGNRVLDPAQDFASTLERVHRAWSSPARP